MSTTTPKAVHGWPSTPSEDRIDKGVVSSAIRVGPGFDHATFEPVSAPVEHCLHCRVVVPGGGFDSVQFGVDGEQVCRDPVHGLTTYAVTAVLRDDAQVEQRAAGVEVIKVEDAYQSDRFAVAGVSST